MVRSGANSEYRMLHLWVESTLGKPMVCAECGTTENRRYHWANLSGEYQKDPSDWIRLCVPCHMKKYTTREPRLPKERTGEEFCTNGHKKTPGNSYIRKNGWVECRICRRNTGIKSRTNASSKVDQYARDRSVLELQAILNIGMSNPSSEVGYQAMVEAIKQSISKLEKP